MRKSKLRLSFMAALAIVVALSGMSVSAQADVLPKSLYVGGFLIGPQAYSFRLFTFFEAIDKAVEANCRVIEAYPGQQLSPDDERQFNHNADPSVWAKAKKKLDEAGVKVVNYGVVGLGNNEEENRKVFDFAKIMDIPCITSEPQEGSFDLLEKLVKEYDIKLAIHNHPIRPDNPDYKYWDPHYVKECVEGRDHRMGACADTGHWARSNVKPVEALKVLEGRIISAHLKDLNRFARDAHDVHFGEGVCNIKEVLDELNRQGFDGNISIEYEHNWENNVDDVAACIEFVREYGKNN